jgi:DNA-binding response OmpR family regulator
LFHPIEEEMSAMKKACESAANSMGVVTLLSVGLVEEDHASLKSILKCSKWDLGPKCEWRLNACPTLESALTALQKARVPIVVCESELRPGTWKEVLEELRTLPDPPFLIVTSRLADERLWAEALNLGAYDVLAKPFDGMEVARIVSLAWLRWKDQHGIPGGATEKMKLASGM